MFRISQREAVHSVGKYLCGRLWNRYGKFLGPGDKQGTSTCCISVDVHAERYSALRVVYMQTSWACSCMLEHVYIFGARRLSSCISSKFGTDVGAAVRRFNYYSSLSAAYFLANFSSVLDSSFLERTLESAFHLELIRKKSVERIFIEVVWKNIDRRRCGFTVQQLISMQHMQIDRSLLVRSNRQLQCRIVP